MSYILEALKKSERERKLGQVPDLATPQETTPEAAPGSGRSWLVPVLLVNSALLLGLLVYLVLWPTFRPSAPGLVPGLDREAAMEETAAGPEQLPPPQVTAGAEPASQAADPATTPEPISPAPATAPEPITPPPAPTDEATVATTPTPPPVEMEPATPSPPAPTGPAPRLSELPEEVRGRITAPNLEVHVYSEIPARRFVMIGGRQYQEGDRLPGDLRLEKITPQGVELSHQGHHFRLNR